jgi:putative oxidoreductase
MSLRMSPYSEALYSLMRFVVGALFASHGAQKLFGMFGGHAVTGKPFLVAAGSIEFVGGVLIALGFIARIAALIASGEMAAVYLTTNAPHGLWPIENKGEAAVLYCFVFLYVAFAGAGRYSLDRALGDTKATA